MKKLLVSIGFFITFLACFTKPALADNTDVLDQANIISPEVQRDIKSINDERMSKLKGHPQIAVVTRNSLDGTGTGNIDDYGQQLFDKYHFGNKKYDNGVVLIIILHPHKIRMQTGYGLESILPDNYINTLMDDRMKSLFKEGKYSTGIDIMVNKMASRIESQSDALASNKDRTKNEDEMATFGKIFASEITMILPLALICIVILIPLVKRNAGDYEDKSDKFDNLVGERNLSSFDRARLDNLSIYEKRKAMGQIAKGVAAGIVIDRLLADHKRRHDDDYHHDHFDDNDSWDNDDSFDDFGGGDFGGFGGDSGGGGGDSSW